MSYFFWHSIAFTFFIFIYFPKRISMLGLSYRVMLCPCLILWSGNKFISLNLLSDINIKMEGIVGNSVCNRIIQLKLKEGSIFSQMNQQLTPFSPSSRGKLVFHSSTTGGKLMSDTLFPGRVEVTGSNIHRSVTINSGRYRDHYYFKQQVSWLVWIWIPFLLNSIASRSSSSNSTISSRIRSFRGPSAGQAMGQRCRLKVKKGWRRWSCQATSGTKSWRASSGNSTCTDLRKSIKSGLRGNMFSLRMSCSGKGIYRNYTWS